MASQTATQWGVTAALIAVIGLSAGVAFWLSLRWIAPSIRERGKGIPVAPAPAEMKPIFPTKQCLPKAPGQQYTPCSKKSDCFDCAERPNDAYLECVQPKYLSKGSINGVPVPADGRSYCLPSEDNVCTPGYSVSEWKAERGRSNWECKCQYPSVLNVFRQGAADTDCTVQTACNRGKYRVCATSRLPCGADADCPSGEKCTMPNRLVSVPRRTEACTVGPEDPDCLPVTYGNATVTESGRVTGTGNPGDPFMVATNSTQGRKAPDWDPNKDGPLVDEDDNPSWVSQAENPNCKEDSTNPGCSALTWGGQCYCDPGQKLVPWKDNPASVDSQEISDFFTCVPDTCAVPEYVPQPAKDGFRDPGPQLITSDVADFQFTSKEGYAPLNISIGRCWCGNVREEKTPAGSKFTSWISYNPPNQPEAYPRCIKDPCNPGGYYDWQTQKCVCKGQYSPDASPGVLGQKCTNFCQANPCANGGLCSYDHEKGKVVCSCGSCSKGQHCEVRLSKHGSPCERTEDCCDGLHCALYFGDAYRQCHG